MYLLREVERFLREHQIAATRFGRNVAGDPMLVHDMRRGREVGPTLSHKIRAHLAEQGQ